MNVIDAMYQRRSIRRYQDTPVEDEKIEILLKAAMAAPSAHNAQPWHFVVAQRDTVEKIRDFHPYGGYNAPMAIIVCGNMDNQHKETAKAFWVQDCTAALQNILNGAVELGLSTVWLGVYPVEKLVEQVTKTLDLPDDIIPLGIVYIGYGAEKKEKRTQYDDKKVVYLDK